MMYVLQTFGGWSPPVVRLFKKMRDKVQSRLSNQQYEDELSWLTRTWHALHRRSACRWPCTWRGSVGDCGRAGAGRWRGRGHEAAIFTSGAAATAA